VTAPDLPTLERDIECDVAIIGGGLTGLWTAWAIKEQDPSLSVTVFEAHTVGAGASGRNGGWMSAKTVGMRPVLAKGPAGREGVLAAETILERSLDEIVEILGADRIDAVRGGWLQLARSPSEWARLQSYVEKSRNWGVTEDHLRVLSTDEALERVRMSKVLGAIYSPDNYRIDPFKLVLAVADLARSVGAEIYIHSEVTGINSDKLTVGSHRVKANRRIVVATEGYSGWERGRKRRLLPMNSSALVTEPLTEEQWEAVGWEGQDGLSGSAHTYFYASRTADGRIAIGGRGKPYRFASAIDHEGRVDSQTVSALQRVLGEIFPQVELSPAHAWSGVLGASRDWSPFIDHEAHTRITRVGGYTGQGVTASYVAARAVADILGGKKTEFSSLPWVRPVPRNWEPEPLRWIGANGLYRVYALADWMEQKSGKPKTAWPALVADRIAGR